MKTFEDDPPGKPLTTSFGDTKTRDTHVFAKLPDNYRSFAYVGFATVGPSGGELLMYAPMRSLKEP